MSSLFCGWQKLIKNENKNRGNSAVEYFIRTRVKICKCKWKSMYGIHEKLDVMLQLDSFWNLYFVLHKFLMNNLVFWFGFIRKFSMEMFMDFKKNFEMFWFKLQLNYWFNFIEFTVNQVNYFNFLKVNI